MDSLSSSPLAFKFLLSNSPKPSLLDKIANIEKLITKQCQLQQENQQILLANSQRLNSLENKVHEIHKYLGLEEVAKTSRLKSTSTKTCRSKNKMEKSMMYSIEERKKVINEGM